MLTERHSVDSTHAPKAADPFTLDVIQEALAATADEMFAVLKKTAMSPIIYEVLDVGTGVSAAQGYYFEVRARLTDMLWHGLAKAAAEDFPAGHFASICGTVVVGHHPQTGRRFAMVEPQMGGWGATAARDGVNAQFSSSHGETFNCPVEIAEARYGFTFRRLALNDEPGGEGDHRGGQGLVKEFAIGGPETEISLGYSHSRQKVWGLAGGAPGTTNRVEICRIDGRRETHALVSGLKLASGDLVRIVTAQGGGWGEASRRSA
jgi:N-methylhydantoinase B